MLANRPLTFWTTVFEEIGESHVPYRAVFRLIWKQRVGSDVLERLEDDVDWGKENSGDTPSRRRVYIHRRITRHGSQKTPAS